MNTVQIRIEQEPTVRQLLSFAEQVSQSGREMLLGSAVRTVRAQSLIGLMSLGLRKGDVVTVLDYSGDEPLYDAAALLGSVLLT